MELVDFCCVDVNSGKLKVTLIFIEWARSKNSKALYVMGLLNHECFLNNLIK